MKKNIFFLLTTFLCVSGVYAKDISDKRNLFGINGGIGLTTMSTGRLDSTAKNGVKVGGLVGFSFEHRFKHVVAIETGVYYNNKGIQQKIESPLLNKSFIRWNFHSIELPLIVKFYVGKKKIFNINAGGYASYAFNVQSRTKIDFKDNTLVQDSDVKNNNLLSNNPKDANGQRLLRPFDAGINVGFEFLSKKGFGAGLRVEQGLVDFTNPKFIVNDGKKIYHTGVQLCAMYKF